MGERFLRKSATTQVKQEVLRVKRIKVEGLFGLYNHDIPLNSEERVTILHGPNGVGKTVLLKMIAAVFGGRFGELSKIRFDRLDIELLNRGALEIKRIEEVRGIVHQTTYAVLDFKMGTNRAAGYETFFTDYDAEGTQFISPYFLWRNGENSETNSTPQWLAEIRNQLQIHLIETQRLLRPASDEKVGGLVPTVHEYARDLQLHITEALAGYAMESQTLDQSFPQRLLKMRSAPSLAASDIKTLLTALEAQRAHLRKIGLLDNITSAPFEMDELDKLDPIQSNAIALYTEDTKKKLGVLEDIANRINLFLNYINGKFRNKSIQINRENGFVVVGHDGQPIEADSLSSGEQHELVQLYDLLFRVEPGTLVLIDEPELSFHIRWQKRYLPELLEIAKTAEFDAIVATHSPFIVGDRSDLMVPLDADIDT